VYKNLSFCEEAIVVYLKDGEGEENSENVRSLTEKVVKFGNK
jgi:hypothetical protein